MWMLYYVSMSQYILRRNRRRSVQVGHPDARGHSSTAQDLRVKDTGERQSQTVLLVYGALLFSAWILFGTLFYAFDKGDKNLYQPLGFIEGFYMAVNVGYSIGLSPPEEDYIPDLVFSTIYILIGAFFVTAVLAFFVERLAEEDGKWFANLKRRDAYEQRVAKGQPPLERLVAFLEYNRWNFAVVVLCVLWLALMMGYSAAATGWTFVESGYFAVSTSSTAGAWSLPAGSPDWLYGVTGIAAAIGVPIMAVAISSVINMVQDRSYLQHMKNEIDSPISSTDKQTLRSCGLLRGDTPLSRSDFIVLSLIRMGTDPEVIEFISNRYPGVDRETVPVILGEGPGMSGRVLRGCIHCPRESSSTSDTQSMPSECASLGVPCDDLDNQPGSAENIEMPARRDESLRRETSPAFEACSSVHKNRPMSWHGEAYPFGASEQPKRAGNNKETFVSGKEHLTRETSSHFEHIAPMPEKMSLSRGPSSVVLGEDTSSSFVVQHGNAVDVIQ